MKGRTTPVKPVPSKYVPPSQLAPARNGNGNGGGAATATAAPAAAAKPAGAPAPPSGPPQVAKPLGESAPDTTRRRLPATRWLILIGAVAAVLAVVVGGWYGLAVAVVLGVLAWLFAKWWAYRARRLELLKGKDPMAQQPGQRGGSRWGPLAGRRPFGGGGASTGGGFGPWGRGRRARGAGGRGRGSSPSRPGRGSSSRSPGSSPTAGSRSNRSRPARTSRPGSARGASSRPGSAAGSRRSRNAAGARRASLLGGGRAGGAGRRGGGAAGRGRSGPRTRPHGPAGGGRRGGGARGRSRVGGGARRPLLGSRGAARGAARGAGGRGRFGGRGGGHGPAGTRRPNRSGSTGRRLTSPSTWFRPNGSTGRTRGTTGNGSTRGGNGGRSLLNRGPVGAWRRHRAARTPHPFTNGGTRAPGGRHRGPGRVRSGASRAWRARPTWAGRGRPTGRHSRTTGATSTGRPRTRTGSPWRARTRTARRAWAHRPTWAGGHGRPSRRRLGGNPHGVPRGGNASGRWRRTPATAGRRRRTPGTGRAGRVWARRPWRRSTAARIRPPRTRLGRRARFARNRLAHARTIAGHVLAGRLSPRQAWQQLGRPGAATRARLARAAHRRGGPGWLSRTRRPLWRRVRTRLAHHARRVHRAATTGLRQALPPLTALPLFGRQARILAAQQAAAAAGHATGGGRRTPGTGGRHRRISRQHRPGRFLPPLPGTGGVPAGAHRRTPAGPNDPQPVLVGVGGPAADGGPAQGGQTIGSFGQWTRQTAPGGTPMAGPETGAARGEYGTTSNGDVATTPMPAWMRAGIEALAQVRRSYDAHNAMTVVQVMDHLPTFQDEVAKMYAHLGQQSINMVALPPQTQEFFARLGQQQQQQSGALRQMMAVCKKSVQEALNRITRQDPRETRWDNRENRPGTY